MKMMKQRWGMEMNACIVYVTRRGEQIGVDHPVNYAHIYERVVVAFVSY
jgi:hypothetical protein